MKAKKRNDQTYLTPYANDDGILYVKIRKPHEVLTSTDGNTVYERSWSGNDEGIIEKAVKTVDASGTAWKHYHARGIWADRETLTYAGNDIVI